MILKNKLCIEYYNLTLYLNCGFHKLYIILYKSKLA